MKRLVRAKSQLTQQLEPLPSKGEKKVKKTLKKSLTNPGNQDRLIKRLKERTRTDSAPNLEKSIV
jgi:mRNA-degrading endonuclease RelE of RelBE toxin-antitoxin system